MQFPLTSPVTSFPKTQGRLYVCLCSTMVFLCIKAIHVHLRKFRNVIFLILNPLGVFPVLMAVRKESFQDTGFPLPQNPSQAKGTGGPWTCGPIGPSSGACTWLWIVIPTTERKRLLPHQPMSPAPETWVCTILRKESTDHPDQNWQEGEIGLIHSLNKYSLSSSQC